MAICPLTICFWKESSQHHSATKSAREAVCSYRLCLVGVSKRLPGGSKWARGVENLSLQHSVHHSPGSDVTRSLELQLLMSLFLRSTCETFAAQNFS